MKDGFKEAGVIQSQSISHDRCQFSKSRQYLSETEREGERGLAIWKKMTPGAPLPLTPSSIGGGPLKREGRKKRKKIDEGKKTEQIASNQLISTSLFLSVLWVLVCSGYRRRESGLWNSFSSSCMSKPARWSTAGGHNQPACISTHLHFKMVLKMAIVTHFRLCDVKYVRVTKYSTWETMHDGGLILCIMLRLNCKN